MLVDCTPTAGNSECRFIFLLANISLIEMSHRPVFFALCSLELLIHLALFVFTFNFQPIIRESSKFHINMLRILRFFNLHNFVLVTSRLFLIIYQFEFLDIGEPESFARSALLTVSIIRLYELSIACYCFFAFVIERVFATIYISDYERVERRHISLWMVFAVLCICLGNAIFSTFGIPGISVLQSVGVVIVYTAGLLYCIPLPAAVVIYRINLKQLDAIRNNSFYTLSKKFQIVENFRAFKLLRDITMVAFVFLVVSSAFVYLIAVTQSDSLSSIYGQLFETLHALALLVTVVVILFSQPTWKSQMAAKLGLRKRVKVPLREFKVSDASQVTNAYFNDLAKSWDT